MNNEQMNANVTRDCMIQVVFAIATWHSIKKDLGHASEQDVSQKGLSISYFIRRWGSVCRCSKTTKTTTVSNAVFFKWKSFAISSHRHHRRRRDRLGRWPWGYYSDSTPSRRGTRVNGTCWYVFFCHKRVDTGCKIVGVQYYRGIATLRENLLFVRDPRNQYDKNAIRVDNVANIQVGQ